MIEFDDLKNDWKRQKASKFILDEQKEVLLTKLKKFNRRVKINNIISTITLSATSIFLVLIWMQIPNRGIFFHGSIASIILLIMVSIVMFWRRLIKWKEPDFSLESADFIDVSLAQLRRSKHLFTSFMPVYHIILYIGLIFYTVDITKEGSLKFTLLMIAGNTIFLGLIAFFSFRHKLKNNKETLYPMIEELEELREGLHNSE